MSTKILGVQLVNSTVDNTPVGSATPASGSFTKVQLAPGNSSAVFWIDNPGANYLRLSNGAVPGVSPVTVDISGNVDASGGVSAASASIRGDVTASGEVNAPGFNGPQNSKTSNGYCTLLNGLILQWGYSSIADGSPGTSVAFPISFSNLCLNVNVTCDYGSAGATRSVAVVKSSISKSGCTLWADGNTAGFWMAIGY